MVVFYLSYYLRLVFVATVCRLHSLLQANAAFLAVEFLPRDAVAMLTSVLTMSSFTRNSLVVRCKFCPVAVYTQADSIFDVFHLKYLVPIADS